MREIKDVFYHACKIGDKKVIDYVLDLNILTKEEIEKGLDSAIISQSNSIISLLKREANIVDIGHSLFNSVIQNNYYKFRFLMGVASLNEINHHDIDQLTPLIIASQKGHFDMVKQLVEAGADINAEDVSGETALYHANYNKHTEIVDYLLDHGAKMSIRDLGHILFDSASKNQINMFKICLNSASINDINHHDIDQLTPLIIASQKGHFEMVKALVEAGADVNAGDVAGETAIYHAMVNQKYDIVEYLLRHNADPAVIGMYGTSFLDHPKMKQLLNKIADE